MLFRVSSASNSWRSVRFEIRPNSHKDRSAGVGIRAPSVDADGALCSSRERTTVRHPFDAVAMAQNPTLLYDGRGL
jgi:hypothetical protein